MRIVVVSSNAGTWMGGEAIKAFQFFKWLLDEGFDAYLVTHALNRDELTAAFGAERIRLVTDTKLTIRIWRSPFSFLLTPIFHLKAAKLVRAFDPADTVVHYVCPISPIEPRFVPRGYRSVIGPINGNIYHPPGFKHRESLKRRLAARLQWTAQRLMGFLFRDKRRAETVLVSGHERTRRSLRWAGVSDSQMIDVLDSGVEKEVLLRSRTKQAGRNPHFISVARLISLKAIDLMIRALAQTDKDVTLTLVGDGPERGNLEALAKRLGVDDRVDFRGFVDHTILMDLYAEHRGLLFPSLCEANGIAMQEAMALGLPVIALNWGGQSALADHTSAVYLPPTDEERLVSDLARAMSNLAGDPERADALSANARKIAEDRFAWNIVAASWTETYQSA